MRKVAIDAIKPWIVSKVTQLLGFEDEVLIGFIFGLLEKVFAPTALFHRIQVNCYLLFQQDTPNPKELQHDLEGFLESDSASFIKELWNLLLSAQSNPTGIPTEFLDQKKEELRKKKVPTPAFFNSPLLPLPPS